jgi:hypothetical protein
MGHLPSILFTFFLLHSSCAIAVGGDREEGEQAPAVRTQEKRETEKKRERESMAAGAYAVLKYVLLYNTKNPNTIE